MRRIKKLYYFYNLGGFKYVCLKLVDKIRHSGKGRLFIYNWLKDLPADEYPIVLPKLYSASTGNQIDLDHPKTFNEKIQWLKLYDTTPLKTQLTDKWKVRDWVSDQIGNKYLIPLLGVWDKFEDIDLDKLPNTFILKANHGSGMNVVVLDKYTHDWESTKQKFDLWLAQNFAFTNVLELQYKDIQPKIIAEQYIETKGGDLYDYKIHCFNGVPTYLQIMGERNPETHRAKHAFYSTEWILQPFTYSVHARWETKKEKPDKLDEMIQIANRLCKGFSYVRVDLYKLDNNDIKFGEMTFTPDSGLAQWTPPGTDEKLGELIKLPIDI